MYTVQESKRAVISVDLFFLADDKSIAILNVIFENMVPKDKKSLLY